MQIGVDQHVFDQVENLPVLLLLADDNAPLLRLWPLQPLTSASIRSTASTLARSDTGCDVYSMSMKGTSPSGRGGV
jgi:hypothetical protein